jgi:uncharacterized delta-60 repeat protein
MTFGGSGHVVADDHIFAVALQPDGKILLGGSVLARYLPGGNLDMTFAQTGVVRFCCSLFAGSVAVRPDGKIVVAGGGLKRYQPNGALDRTFGNDGQVVTGIPFSAMALQPDGKIVAAGGAQNRYSLARYWPSGDPDSTFGDNGLVTTDVRGFGNSFAAALAIQPDGRLVLAGPAAGCSCDDFDFALARYEGAAPGGPENVNDLVRLDSLRTFFDGTPVPSGPAGTLTIQAHFTNTSFTPINAPEFLVSELSNRNLLLNGDQPPGTEGAFLTPDVGSDGDLSPGEAFTVEFRIGLRNGLRFAFLVDLLGTPAP